MRDNDFLFTLGLDAFTETPPDLDCPGVYAAISPESGQVRYIGQSKHVLKRRTQHEADGKKKWTKEAKWLFYPMGGGESERLVLETILILRYRPEFNRSIKLGLSKTGDFHELQFVRSRRSR